MTVVRETIQVNGPEHQKWAPVDPGAHGARYETLGVSDDTVYLSTVELRKGRNKHSGKTYAYLRDQGLSCYSWRRGRLRFYRKAVSYVGGVKRVDFREDTTWAVESALLPITQRTSRTNRLNEALLKARGFKTMQDMMLSEYPLAQELPPARGITPLLVHTNVQDFTRAFFGTSRYRKDLVRGVANRGWMAQGGPDRLLLLKIFAPFVPVDWIARDLLELPTLTASALMHRERVELPMTLPGMRRMIRTASPKQVRRLFNTFGDHMVARYGNIMVDALKNFRLIIEADPSYRLDALGFDSWDVLHDILAADQRRIGEPNVKIEYKGKAAELPGTYGEYTIVAPEDTHTLIGWGARMNNCIGGYGRQATNGHTLLYAVMKGGEMIANMEIEPKRGVIRQLVGKNNAHLPREIANEIKAPVLGVWPPAIQPAGRSIHDVQITMDGLAGGFRDFGEQARLYMANVNAFADVNRPLLAELNAIAQVGNIAARGLF